LTIFAPIVASATVLLLRAILLMWRVTLMAVGLGRATLLVLLLLMSIAATIPIAEPTESATALLAATPSLVKPDGLRIVVWLVRYSGTRLRAPLDRSRRSRRAWRW
jgi:hypothetical protein